MTDPDSSGHRVPTSDDIEVSTYLEIAREKSGERPILSDEPPAAGPETVLVLDFGSQYSMLIARRIRECHVYCELVPYDTPWEKIAHLNPKGFILSGGPASVYDAGRAAGPVLHLRKRPAGAWASATACKLSRTSSAAGSRPARSRVRARRPPPGRADGAVRRPAAGHARLDEPRRPDRRRCRPAFSSLAYTENSPVAVMGNDHGMLGLQFHPEVVHTPQGKQILENFVYRVCGCHGNWTIGNFVNESIDRISEQVGTGR